ncbi:MAG: EamA family transporter [Rhodobacterales bacterium]|nr:MAG: EamA family transporter [Rhodobacterales bacterium]PIE08891.1 MAG: EamA family transporter [Rhodobacterales bacterium]
MFRSPQLTGAALMVAAGFCFALVNTLVQGATMGRGAASTAVTFWQYLIALLLYLPWTWRHRTAVFATKHPYLQVLRVVLGAIGVQFWAYGLAHVEIWQAIALILLSPFFVTIGAWAVLREKVTPARWLAVIVGMIGGAIILEPWSESFTLYALLPVTAAAFWAASSVVTKHLTHEDTPETITIYLLLLLTPINGVLGVGTDIALPTNAIWLVAAAGLATAAAQHALARAYSLADAAFLQPFDHLKLVFNVTLGFAVFGFAPSGSMWLGAAIIIAASLTLMRLERD